MKWNEERGLSLIEVLLASVILLIALVPMMRVFLYELRVSNRAYKMGIANNLAREMAEEIRTQNFSEEYAVYTNTGSTYFYRKHWPAPGMPPQSFGREDTSEQPTNWRASGGRIMVYDDVDDYDGWCRGPECECDPADTAIGLCDTTPVETHDGHRNDGRDGYPDYRPFTRWVRVENVDVNLFETFQRDPFENATQEILTIHRFNFDNWTTRIYDNDGYMTGRSRIKLIKVTVSVSGLGVEDQEVKDISFAVMPMSVSTGMAER